jgi:hypothetical protein
VKTFSIREAKSKLNRVADLALQGEYVFIVHKSKLLQLQPMSSAASIPVRPPGYFRDCYTKREAKASNRQASHSPKKLVP